jgi:O-antigen/teichoic acid export membrane protein
VGIYSVSMRFSMLMEVVVTSFAIAWRPFYYNRAESSDAHMLFRQLITLWAAFIIFIGLVVSMFAREAVMIFTLPEYYSVYTIIPILVLGHVFLAFYFFYVSALLYDHRTYMLPILACIAYLFDILLLNIIGSRIGIVGAALCKSLTYCALLFFAYKFCFKNSRIQFEHKKILKISIIGLIIFLIGFNIKLPYFTVNIIIKSLLVLSYIFILQLSKLVNFSKIGLFLKEIKQDMFAAEESPLE